jgi:hypothetical protein
MVILKVGECEMTRSNDTGLAAGVAALAICESLLLALADLKVVSAKDVADVLRDAASAHSPPPPPAGAHSEALHNEAVAIIERIIASVRVP